MSSSMTKPKKWLVHPVKTQISLGICRAWSESLVCAWRKLGSLTTHWAHSEDADQTGQMLRLIWVFAGHRGHFVGFVVRRQLNGNLKSITSQIVSSYMWTLPDHQGGSLKWALKVLIKVLIKHTTFYQNFKISLIWIKNFPIYSIRFW